MFTKVIPPYCANSAKYVGYLLVTVNQEPAHLYNSSTNKCLHLNYLALLHHVKYV